MKIYDQRSWTEKPKSEINHPTAISFEHWLTNHWSPTQQSTGDEYYWQHQNQLQKSSLSFAAKPLMNNAHKLYSSINDEAAFNPPTPEEITHKAETKHLSINTMSSTDSISPKVQQTTAQLAPLPPNTETFSIHSASTTLRPITEQGAQSKETKTVMGQIKCSLFKNCHLFIQGEQAELTFNTQDLNTQEQKELIYLVQDYLKKKGLVLNRLIINGVKHD